MALPQLHNSNAHHGARIRVLDVASIVICIPVSMNVITRQAHPTVMLVVVTEGVAPGYMPGNVAQQFVEILVPLNFSMCAVGVVVVVTCAPVPIPSTSAVALVAFMSGRGGVTVLQFARIGVCNRVLDVASLAQMGLVLGRATHQLHFLLPTLTPGLWNVLDPSQTSAHRIPRFPSRMDPLSSLSKVQTRVLLTTDEVCAQTQL